MSPSDEDQLHMAIESGDYEAARPALERYVACFQSVPRAAEEILRAKDLLEWAMHTVRTARGKMRAEFSFLSASNDGEPPAAGAHTWEIDI